MCSPVSLCRAAVNTACCVMDTTSKASAPSLSFNNLHMLLFWDRLAELTHHRLDHTIQASLAAMAILLQRTQWRLSMRELQAHRTTHASTKAWHRYVSLVQFVTVSVLLWTCTSADCMLLLLSCDGGCAGIMQRPAQAR
jgi:hypothetical protein